MQLSTRGQLLQSVQKSSAQEVISCSSCKRAQHKRSTRAAHAKELSTRGRLMQLNTRGHLMQKSSCSSVQEVSSCSSCKRAHAAQHKRSAHAEELMQLSTRGQ